MAKLCAILLVAGSMMSWADEDPFAPANLPRNEWPEPEALTRLRTATPDQLVDVLLQPDAAIRERDHTVIGQHDVSLWDRAKQHLRPVPPEVRGRLAQMLESERADQRLNALEVLKEDEPKFLAPLTEVIVRLAADNDRRIRFVAYAILPRIKNEAAEEFLLVALARLTAGGKPDACADDEISAVVQALCWNPHDTGKVIAAVAPLIDEKTSNLTVVWNAMRISSELSRSKEFGEKLIAQYWNILSTTADDSLPGIATDAMCDDDARTLPYLRKTPEIANAKARGYASGELAGHHKFKPWREQDLMDKLLNDPSPRVRLLTVANLCDRRKDPDPGLLAITAMNVIQTETDTDVLQGARLGIFKVLENASLEERSRIWADPRLKLASFLLKGLESPEFRPLIVFKIGEQSREQWNAKEEPEKLRLCRTWLEEKAKTCPNKQ